MQKRKTKLIRPKMTIGAGASCTEQQQTTKNNNTIMNGEAVKPVLVPVPGGCAGGCGWPLGAILCIHLLMALDSQSMVLFADAAVVFFTCHKMNVQRLAFCTVYCTIQLNVQTNSVLNCIKLIKTRHVNRQSASVIAERVR